MIVIKTSDPYSSHMKKPIKETLQELPPHPGEILKNLMEQHKLSGQALATAIFVPKARIHRIIRKEHGVSPDMAWRLSKYFSNDPLYWARLQNKYDIYKHYNENPERYDLIMPYAHLYRLKKES